MKLKLFLPFFLFLPLLFVACEDNDDVKTIETVEIDKTTLKVNNFIWDVMDEVYLWQEKMPRDININTETDSKAYFKKLLYTTDDKWSFITDDVEGLLGSFDGHEKTFGYSLIAGKFSNTDNYFFIVEYVENSSPASEAGMKRGDIIIKINGQSITLDNYSEIIYGNTITITKGVLVDNSIAEGGNVTLTSREMDINPILISKVILNEGKKIGYIVYNQFIEDYNSHLDEVFQFFKDEDVSDVILDLRFNSGGYVTAAIHLCSIIAPYNVVSNSQVLIKKQWNKLYQNYWTSKNIMEQLQSTFNPEVTVNMNLSNIYILTSSGTASASELTISGLEPYMNVTTIGEATSGKYTASSTFQPVINNDGDLDQEIKNWAIQPIIFKYSNAVGKTDFKDGLPATHEVEEILLDTYVPQLGDEDEPLLAKAVELITGKKTKSTRISAEPEWERSMRVKSKYDKQKQTLLIPNPLN